MYEKHEQLFDLDEECTLWKYMNFSKFINMLKGKLYFNRLDNFEDVFEGTFPQFNVEHRKDVYGNVIIPQNTYDALEQMMKKYIYVSCFHKSEYETAFMWKQYADNDGITIRTTSERLKKSFDKTPVAIHISAVKYMDYSKEFMPEGNGLYLGLHKRKSFEPESEVRCIYMKTPTSKPDPANPSDTIIDPSEKTPYGEYIDANQGLKAREGGRKTAQKSRECKYVANKSHNTLLRCLRQ